MFSSGSSDNQIKRMPKNQPSKPAPSKAAVSPKKSGKGEPAPARIFSRILLHLLGVVLLVGGVAFLTIQSKKYIEAETAGPVGPLRIALVNKPVWMSDFLAGQIAATVPSNSSSAFDHDLLVATAEKLRANPWVAKVNQVRRVYGQQPGDTLEVDCDFRAPIALVQWDNSYWLVDNDGVVLPEKFSADNLEKITIGRDGRTCFRIIQGVHMAPPASGKKWVGADLVAGLDLVKLFDGKLYLDDVRAIDVTNFGGRVRRADPQITLATRYNTQIWWGRPINAKDAFVEARAARKLEILRAVVKQDGRIDANHAYVDVRYDDPLVPTAQPTEARTVDDPNR
jgi:cell division septal protein FtsQ